MSTTHMNRKEAFVARVDIDPEWKVVGQHPASHATVYEERRPYSTNLPELDESGKQVWEPHPMNNSPSYRRRVVETVWKPWRFTLADDGNGNVRKEEYHEPSAVELRERDIARRKHDLLAGLVQGMAERGLSPDDLLDRLMPADDEGASDAESEFPRHVGGNRWLLSNGTEARGNRAVADAAEAKIRLAD